MWQSFGRRRPRRQSSQILGRRTESARGTALRGKESPIEETNEMAERSVSTTGILGRGRTGSRTVPLSQSRTSSLKDMFLQGKLFVGRKGSTGSVQQSLKSISLIEKTARLRGRSMGGTTAATVTRGMKSSMSHRRGRSLGLIGSSSRRRAASHLPPSPPHSATRKGSMLKSVKSLGSGLRKFSQRVMETSPGDLVRTRSRGDTFDSFFSRRSRTGSRLGSTRSVGSDQFLLQTSTGNPIRVALTEIHMMINGHQILYENIIYWGHTPEFFKVSYVENLYCADQRRRDLCLYPVSRQALGEYRKLYLSASKGPVYSIQPVDLAEMMQARISHLLEQQKLAEEVDFHEVSQTELRGVLRQVDNHHTENHVVDTRSGRLSSIRELEAMFKSQQYVPRTLGSVTMLAELNEDDVLGSAGTKQHRRKSVPRGSDGNARMRKSESESDQKSNEGVPQKRHSTGEVQWRGRGTGDWEKRHERYSVAA